VENHCASRDASVTRGSDHLLDRLVKLRITDADDDDVRGGGFRRERPGRSSDARWPLAVKTHDLDT
jgi:hypothetical protein